ncbi:LAETG motif-containing sortase-dependent surface protein, partial [Streptomyces sp. SID3343]|uniref:LAETG motif-containing sortase-dependent surface protein n=1 Tax=Streptomyces sp. SID3343 TaxID=2690260 RepID=UPI00136F86DF
RPPTVKPGDPASPSPVPADRLAETGGSSNTPMLIGGGAALLALGGATIVLVRRRGRVAA